MIGHRTDDVPLGQDPETPHRLISRTDVARAAGVTPQAISNWVARHPDFPTPVGRGAGQRFPVTATARWLDRRTVPIDRLQPGETRGTTYGSRFRTAVGLPVPEDHVGIRRAPAPLVVEKPWTRLGDLLSRGDEPAAAEIEVLALQCMRIVDPAGWRQLTAAPRSDPDALGRARARLQPSLVRATAALDGLAGDPWRRDQRIQLVHSLFAEADPSTFDHLLDHLATQRGGSSGEFLMPTQLARLMVALADPQPGERVHDPCCGYGSLLVASGGYAVSTPPESGGPTVLTGRAAVARSHAVAAMSAAVHGVPVQIHPDPSNDLGMVDVTPGQFDVVLLNPPFGRNAWRLADAHAQWQWPYGSPSPHSVAFAWLQVAAEAVSPRGRAVVLMPASSTSPSATSECAIREQMLRKGVIRCVVELPGNLFRETAVPVTVWVLGPVRPTGARDVLLIDGRAAAERMSTTHRELTEQGCDAIVELYRDMLAGTVPMPLAVHGPSATPVDLSELEKHGFDLRPSAYLSRYRSPAVQRLPADLRALTDEMARLDALARAADRDLDEQLRRLAR